jgi:hypothetical protein
MRNKYLGDSLDMAKRALVQVLANVGYSVVVFPLPSESAMDFGLYSKILGADHHPSVRVMGKSGLSFCGNQRNQYAVWMTKTIQSLPLSDRLFILLDPDKGIRKSGQKEKNHFITILEIEGLKNAKSGSVIGVYHHKNAAGLSFDEVLNLLGNGCFYYDFGAAALFFVSSKPSAVDVLVSSIEEHFGAMRLYA